VRPNRAVTALWSVVIVVLVVLELAEVTHLFTFPISAVLADPVTLVVSLVFTTIVAIIGAIFVGIYMSTRLLGPRAFSPFEEEMLRMRAELREVRRAVEELRDRAGGPAPEAPRDGAGRR
jgi:MFS superfamily sulfate permease-like transporter